MSIPVGPALDRIVAERVLGVVPCEHWEISYMKGDVWGDAWFRKDGPGECPHDWKRGWPGPCFPAKDWQEGTSAGGEFDLPLSTNVGAAMAVVEATGPLPRGWVWMLRTMKDGVPGRFASVGYPRRPADSTHASAEASGDSFPEAVCRAALLGAADQEIRP